MKIFSSHRKKLEPRRRFGGHTFQNKIKARANYRRVFSAPFSWKLWRWLGYGLLAVFIYFFVLSSYFVISDISVAGNSQVSTQQIQDAIRQAGQSRLFLVKKANFFLITQGRASSMLTGAIPMIKKITKYQRIWPNKIELTVEERTPGFAIKSSNKYFLVDDEGIVVKLISDIGNLLVAEDSVVENFAAGEALPNAKMAPFIISMNRSWGSKVTSQINVVKFPGKESNDVQFVSTEGWMVFFDVTRSVSSQLTNLAVLLNKQITAKDRGRLAYIDLRLSNWAYYCFKDSPCSQVPQTQENTNVQK